MKLKHCFKSGMILGEVIFAFFLCGILLAISIYMFKSTDITKTPYIYSILKNMPVAIRAAIDDCYDDGLCETKTELPQNMVTACQVIADSLVTVGEVHCSEKGNDKYQYKTENGFETYGMNFQLANGIAFYGFVQPHGWFSVRDLDQSDDDANYYVDVYVDINGPKNGKNKYGDDIFLFRFFRNGMVSPSYDIELRNYDATVDEEYFPYRILLNKAENENNREQRVIEVLDARTNQQIQDDLPFLEKVSFKEAVCKTNTKAFQRYFQGEDCNGIDILPACDFDSPSAHDIATYPHLGDNTAYCTFEPVKPRGSGVFKIFGI